MPIEIREIVIKTDVRSDVTDHDESLVREEVNRFKSQLMIECKKMVVDQLKRKKNRR